MHAWQRRWPPGLHIQMEDNSIDYKSVDKASQEAPQIARTSLLASCSSVRRFADLLDPLKIWIRCMAPAPVLVPLPVHAPYMKLRTNSLIYIRPICCLRPFGRRTPTSGRLTQAARDARFRNSHDGRIQEKAVPVRARIGHGIRPCAQAFTQPDSITTQSRAFDASLARF